MAQSLSQVYLHIIFSTKHRQKFIDKNIDDQLYGYIAGVIKSLNGGQIIIGGMEDHIHILATLPRTSTIANFIMEIKSASSKWFKTLGKKYETFAWQGGYAVFSVSQSNITTVTNYIKNQDIHHKKQTFQEETIEFLKRYNVEYDERYLWD